MALGDNSGLTEYYLRQLDACERAYNAGVLAALYDAITYCTQGNIPLPSWVAKAMLETLEMLFAGNFSSGAGRTGNPKARIKEDIKHYTRWDMVKWVRRHQETVRAEYQEVLQRPELSKEDRDRLIKYAPYDAGSTLEDAYHHTTEALKGTVAFGSAATIKRSYILVEKSLRDPSQAGRFYLVKWQTTKRLRLEGP